MTDITYNGWQNHQTWLVHCWFSDSWRCQDDIDNTEAYLEELVDELETGFLKDMICLSEISWEELKESCFPEQEEIEAA
jgi:hypothetical protein